MKYILTLLIGLIISFAFANDDMNKANALYQKGDYTGAIKIYEGIEKHELEAPELYFNLGNAYYKTNNTAKAILYYERAYKLSPDDDDIITNLKLANLKVVDKVSPVPTIFYSRWINSIANALSGTKWAVLNILILLAALLVTVLFFISRSPVIKRGSFLGGVALIAFFIISYMFADMQHNQQSKGSFAIVFAQSTYVKSSPDDKSTDLFILHEGTKVEVVDTIGEWKKIKLLNGNIGWIQSKEIETI